MTTSGPPGQELPDVDPASYPPPAPLPAPAADLAPSAGQRPRPHLAWLLPAALALGLLAGLLGGVVGFVAAQSRQSVLIDPGRATLAQVSDGSVSRRPGSVAGIAAAVLPSVVSIKALAPNGQGGTGSGFVVRSDGYILTNNHVIAAAGKNGRITVTFNDGKSAVATVVGSTTTYDLAVLKVAARGATPAALGDSDSLVVGDPVIAIGSPLGLSGTVTQGIVSALNRPVTAGEGSADVSYFSAIQTDAAINPGNSGGPLVDRHGRVIGVNSAIATLGGGGGQAGNIGLGFAIPINQARRIADELIAHGHAATPVVGVNLDLSYPGPGARILPHTVNGTAPIVPGGPAALAGLQPGDVVTAVDGHPVDTYQDFVVDIRSHVPGDTLTLTVQRGGKTQNFSVTLQAAQGAP